MVFAVLGTVVITLTVSSCAPDDATDTPPEASDPEVEFQQQLDALRFAVKHVAERAGRNQILLGTRDQGRDAQDVVRRLAEALGSGLEARVREEVPSCPEGYVFVSREGTCTDTEVVTVYYPTLAEFSGDRATVVVAAEQSFGSNWWSSRGMEPPAWRTILGPDASARSYTELHIERTSDGWVVVEMSIAIQH